MRHTIFLFGEAEKGDFCTPLWCRSLAQLVEVLGNPPGESEGIPYAIQAVLNSRDLIFYRIKEEGFSKQDYFRGFKLLKNKDAFPVLSAICMPGVGDAEILEQTRPLCTLHQSLLIITEKDLYDFLTVANF